MLRPVKRTKRELLLLALPALAVWLVWWPCLTGGFIRDDIPYVVDNPAVVAPTPIAETLLTPFPAQAELGLWRPLTTLSLRADQCIAFALGREIPDALLPHATNLILASLAALLLAQLARLLGWSLFESALVGTFFAVATARAESVCWISGRAECLMVLTALATLVAVARPGRLFFSALAAALGTLFCVLAKEQGFMLPLILWFLPGSRREKLIRAGAALTAAALCLALRVHVLGSFGPEGMLCVLREHDLFDRTLFALQWLCEYAALVIWPFTLNNDYDPPTAPSILYSVLAVFIIIRLGASAVRRPEAERFGALLFLLPLLPVLNLFTRTGETFAERFLALPLAGAALFFVPRKAGCAWILPPLLLILVQAPFAVRQAFAWRSEASLVQAMADQGVSESAVARRRAYIDRSEAVLLGADAATSGRLLRSAAAHLATAHELVPFDRETTLDLAKLVKQGAERLAPEARREQLARAESLVREVLAAEPGLAHAHAVLGEILAEEQRPSEARASFTRALELDPADTQSLQWWLSLVPPDELAARARQIRETCRALEVRAARRPCDPLPLLALAAALQETELPAALGHARSALKIARSPLARVAAAGAVAQCLARLERQAEAAGVLEHVREALLAEADAGVAQSRVQRLHALQQLATLLGRKEETLQWLDERIRWTTNPTEGAGLEAERRMLATR